MTEIGVIGSDEAVCVLEGLLGMSEKVAAVQSLYADDAPKRFDILLINGTGSIAPMFINELIPGSFVVVNTDDKALHNYLGGCRGWLVTYGFSSKACVTASSVIKQPNESIHLCIQRSLPTLTGDTLEPQEFPVSFKSPKNIHCALGAVTAGLIAGISPESFSE